MLQVIENLPSSKFSVPTVDGEFRYIERMALAQSTVIWNGFFRLRVSLPVNVNFLFLLVHN
jgi:hypothetical protein